MLEASVWFFPGLCCDGSAAFSSLFSFCFFWGRGCWEFPRKFCFLISGGSGYSSITRSCFLFFLFFWVGLFLFGKSSLNFVSV